MSLLPHPREDAYRSLPGTPYMERGVLTSREMDEAIQHVRMGVDGGDYFSGVSPRYAMSGGRSGMRDRSPYGVDPEGYTGGPAGLHEMGLVDLVRR
jgi:hypothetical protein